MSKLFGFQSPTRPHLTRGSTGLAGEVGDLRRDVNETFAKLENEGGYFRTDEPGAPPTADVDALKTSFPTASTEQVLAASDLDGFYGNGGEMLPPRNPTVTSSNHAHVTAVTVVFAGRLRVDGKLVPHSVTVTTTNGGNTTDASTGVLSIVESVTIPAMGGASGALELGYGARIGMETKIRARAGLIRPIREIAAGAVVTNGAFATPTGSPVTVYTPASAPNGSNTYAVTYEVDPS
jgi:hypothetical protein